VAEVGGELTQPSRTAGGGLRHEGTESHVTNTSLSHRTGVEDAPQPPVVEAELIVAEKVAPSSVRCGL
jgi:hypothetical protein